MCTKALLTILSWFGIAAHVCAKVQIYLLLYLLNIFTILRLSQGTLVQRLCQCVHKSTILTILRLLSRKLDLIRKTSQVWAAPATVPPSDPNIQKSNQYWS